MSQLFQRVLELIQRNEVRISAHGYDEMMADDIFIKDVLANVSNGIVIEDYPHYPKGPCVLVLQKDTMGKSIHVVWGIPKSVLSPAVLVTAYRPNPQLWTSDFKQRRRS
jgi:hypothetical protein